MVHVNVENPDYIVSYIISERKKQTQSLHIKAIIPRFKISRCLHNILISFLKIKLLKGNIFYAYYRSYLNNINSSHGSLPRRSN